MDEVKKMLKTVIQGQQALKNELLGEIAKLQKSQEIFKQETKESFEAINRRLDKQGKQLAYLEDDAPTREEHDILAKKVKKIEQHLKN